MIRSAVRTGFVAAWAVAWLGLAGCSSKPEKPRDPGEVNLRKIVQAYDLGEYHLHRPPRNEDELKRFLEGLGETGDLNEILHSPRDGQPYVILFGPPLDSDARDTVLAYEKTGADGKRYVVTLSRDIKVLTDQEFAGATFAKGHRPPRDK
jgi:hypothetical protein